MTGLILFAISVLFFVCPARSALALDMPETTLPFIRTETSEENVMISDKLYCIAPSDEQAIEIASAYGLTFLKRDGLIAYFINETGIETYELIRTGLEKGLPPIAEVSPRDLFPSDSPDAFPERK